MRALVSPEDLLERLKSYDFAITYDSELSPRLEKPSELRAGDLGLAGIAISAKENSLVCWVRREVEYEVREGRDLTNTCLKPAFTCSPDFLSALRAFGLPLPRGSKISDLLVELRGESE